MILSCNFLRICMPKEVLSLSRKEQEKIKVTHFTDLARSALVGIIIPRDLGRSSGKFLVVPTATTLKKSGVRFVPGGCILDMKCIRRKFLVWQCELRMPHVDITTFSECIFGNIRSLEHCAYESISSHFSNFLLFMGSLVDSEDALDFLVTEKIISNKLGDEAEVLKFLKRVSEGITSPEVDAWGVYESLHAQVTFCDDV
ncbi:hypothetical protein Q3G72_034061 [Acer saccharum]|nr:hypothetical protein Q3G72_034061 [Acer saccharum]